MINPSEAFAGFSVDDLGRAQKFYAGTLGLAVTRKFGQLRIALSEHTQLLLYPKPDHTPATYTALYFPVDDVERAVDELTAKGVRFEQYTRPKTDAKGIYRGRGPTIAWFRDPAGNVLAVVERS